MWYLTSQSDPRIIYIVPQKEIIIGRSIDVQYCNFAVADDPSISRKHASLSVFNNILYLQDLGSKYGTYKNNDSANLESNVRQIINIGDIIKFGKMNCIWKTHYVNFVTCASTLKWENIQDLKSDLGKLGATFKSEWDDCCTYLTMPVITLTIKVVLALVQGSFIVSNEFWSKCLEAVSNHTVLPDPKSYIPQIVESTLSKVVSFLPDENRKTLFTGKTIIFFSRRQLDTYKNVLMKGSATALLLSETKMTKSMLCNENIIVIQYNLISTSQDTQTQRNQINDIVDYLKSKGKRVVGDAEIGLAILYCSLNKYCNPNIDFSTEVIKRASDVNDKPRNILADESEEPLPTSSKQEKVVIEESPNTTINNDGIVTKRKWEDNDMRIANPNKKLAIDNDKISELSSIKRSYEDPDCSNLNPAKKIALESGNENIFFNFTETSSTVVNAYDVCKKLNLSKPLKRKMIDEQNIESEDDNLFNFIEENPKPIKIAKDEDLDHNMANSYKANISQKNLDNYGNDKFDISALRGIKLVELIQSNLKTEYYTNVDARNVNVKIEDLSDIDGKLNDLDLGSTTVILRSDLIVKKEPIELNAEDSKVKNFKKFKKVWPVKMQISIIPNPSLNVVQSNVSDKISSVSDIAL